MLLILSLIMPTAASAAVQSGVIGDADGDGKLTILDAAAIQRHLSGEKLLSDNAVRRSIVTGGAELSILDATAIQRRLANLIDAFPAEIEASLPDEPQNPAQSTDTISAYEQHVINLINDIRRENNLPELSADADLCRIAHVKAQDMHDAGYFDHTSPIYGTPFEMLSAFGVSYRSAGENIAYGYRNPQAVVEGWMSSPGHRANILNPAYTKVGVGYIADGCYWAQLFTD